MAPKKKTEKMSLGTFLGDQSLGSWADEMEDMPISSSDRRTDSRTGYGERRQYQPRPDFGAARDYQSSYSGPPQHEQLPLPTKPPYTAHLGNLSFDVTQKDVEDFFSGCQVTNVRIVEDKIDHKPKGFGYVEFATIDGLKEALTRGGSQFQGRNVRVSVAEPPKERQETRELNDWTRKGPLPDLPRTERRPSDRGGFQQGMASPDAAGAERGGDRRRQPLFEGNWERKGPLSPAAPPTPVAEGGNRPPQRSERSYDRRSSPSWGEGRSQDGSRPPQRDRPERPEKPERTPTAAEMDSQWRARMKPDAPPPKSPTTATPEPSVPSSPVAAPPAPTVRPKLNLQKRTVSEVPQDDSVTSAGDSKASPFGAARPIDTATKEREIEAKRVALRLKKDEEEKEQQAKRAAEKAEKAEKAAAKAAAGGNETVTSPTTEDGKEKENGAGATNQKPSYEILRRMTEQEENGDGVEHDAEDVPTIPANGEPPDHESVKPKELVREMGSDNTPIATADALEEDGWSTVPAKNSKSNTKGRRGGNQGARAIAS